MRLATKILILIVILAISLELTNAKRRGGGSRSRGSSSRGSSSRGYSSRGSSSRGSGVSRSTYNQKKKSKSLSTLKKAAVIGVGAYVGYKATKGAAKLFKKAFQGPDFDGPDFDTWNRWRQVDGILCITNSHCNWIDPNFECQHVRSFGWNLSPDYRFNGLRPTGECGCGYGFVLDSRDLRCLYYRSKGSRTIPGIIVFVGILFSYCF